MKTLDLDKIHLRASAPARPAAAINIASGTIQGVSLLTAGREATGYGIWVDQATLATFQTLLQGRRLKAYATHDSGIDGTLEEVGYWENPRLEGNQLRADFTALDAWRKFQPDEFATLFELASKLPDEFGASLSFRFTLAWVRRIGADAPTSRTFSVTGENVFNPPMPADALRAMPSVRAIEVYSCDFVDQPAANAGLFSAGSRKPVFPALRGVDRAAAAFNAQFARRGKPAAVAVGVSPARLAGDHGKNLTGWRRTAAAWNKLFSTIKK